MDGARHLIQVASVHWDAWRTRINGWRSVLTIRPPAPMLGCSAAAAAGIVFSDRFPLPILWLIGVTLLCGGWLLWKPGGWKCAAMAFLTFAAVHGMTHHHNPGRPFETWLSSGPRTVHTRGLVVSDVRVQEGFRPGTIRARFEIETAHVKADDFLLQSPIRLMVSIDQAKEMAVQCGDLIDLHGIASAHSPTRNPGQFDYGSYLRRQGIFASIRLEDARSCAIVASGYGVPHLAWSAKARRWMRDQLARDLDDSPDVANLIQSMVLGMQSETPDEMREAFQHTGTMHLFAVSGLNIAMLALMAAMILKPLGVPRRIVPVLIIPILIGYALITGLSASCVRATIMGALVCAAIIVDRPAVLLNSLGTAALLIFAADTNELFSIGFQFSFLLVLALVALVPPIERALERIGMPDDMVPTSLWNLRQRTQARAARIMAQAFAVSAASWLGSFLPTAAYFHLVSPSAILANIIAVVLAFFILALGLLSSVCGLFSPWLSVVCNNANWGCVHLLLIVVRVFTDLPAGHWYVGPVTLQPAPKARITVFDAGDGGCTLVQIGGRSWLLDAGPSHSFRSIIQPGLRHRGINKLDGLILTHGDAQHLGGVTEVLAEFLPTRVLDAPLRDRSSTRKTVHLWMNERGAGRLLAVAGTRVQLATGNTQASFQIVFPPAGHQGNLADDKALVVLLEIADKRILFTSDSGYSTEQWLLKNRPDLRANIVVKGHHARDFSGSTDLLRQLGCHTVVCGSGGFRDDPKALDLWTAEVETMGIQVLRQDHSGAVIAELREGKWTLTPFLKQPPHKGTAF